MASTVAASGSCLVLVALLGAAHGDGPASCQADDLDCEDPERGAGVDDRTGDKLGMMVRARGMPESATVPPAPFTVDAGAPPQTAPLKRSVTADELAAFNDQGYVVLRGFFSAAEMDMARQCMVDDPLVMGGRLGRNISVADASGLQTKLTLWWNFGDDVYGQMGRSASMMQAAADLMGGSEPYSSHTKILLKEPFTGGAWEWHQDFGYWYAQGLNQPDKIVSGIIAIDENGRDNGAMRVLTKSHKLGRLDHGVFGGQAGADPERVLAAIGIPGYDVKTLLLAPGDVAFTHSNLLHCSRPNPSARWRRNVIVAYNSNGNGPMPSYGIADQRPYTKVDVVPDSAVLSRGCVKLDARRDDFLASSSEGEVLGTISKVAAPEHGSP